MTKGLSLKDLINQLSFSNKVFKQCADIFLQFYSKCERSAIVKRGKALDKVEKENTLSIQTNEKRQNWGQRCVEILRVHNQNRTNKGGKNIVTCILAFLKYFCPAIPKKGMCVDVSKRMRENKLISWQTRGPGPSVLHLLCDSGAVPPFSASQDDFYYPLTTFLVFVIFSSNLVAKLQMRAFENSGVLKSFASIKANSLFAYMLISVQPSLTWQSSKKDEMKASSISLTTVRVRNVNSGPTPDLLDQQLYRSSPAICDVTNPPGDAGIVEV